MTTLAQDKKALMAALALALVDQPRANLNELAGAVGISKATLYRLCRTREQLVQQIMAYCVEELRAQVEAAELEKGVPLETLRRLIVQTLGSSEVHAFLLYYWRDATSDPTKEAGWEAALDAFFLRGQREGAFRIDIPAPALTELWITLVIGMIDAERRGRVARVALSDLIEHVFLHGTQVRDEN